MSNIITIEMIGMTAQKTLDILKQHQVHSITDLDRIIEKTPIVGNPQEEYITFEMRPSRAKTKAYTISNIKPGCGIILETRINNSLNYSIIIAKTNSIIAEYDQFERDANGNYMQMRIIRDAGMGLIIPEIQALARYRH